MESQEYLQLNSKILALAKKVQDLEANNAKVETAAAADIREAALKADLDELATEISTVDKKIQMVKLPEASRYYLSEQEISYLKKTIKEIQTVKAEAEKVLAALISKIKYVSNIS